MKQEQVLKLIPLRKDMKRELNTLLKQKKQLDDAITIISRALVGIEGVTLFRGFPIYVVRFPGNSDIEIWPGCSETQRWAYLSRHEGGLYVALGFRNESRDGRRILADRIQLNRALKAAKEWVAFGGKQ